MTDENDLEYRVRALETSVRRYCGAIEAAFAYEPELDDQIDDIVNSVTRLGIATERVTTELSALTAEQDELRKEQTALRLRLPERSDTHPSDLDFEDKVKMVREQAYRRAIRMNGRVALDYKDIQWGMFDGKIYSPVAYRLMRRAAGVNDDNKPIEDVPGFAIRDGSPMKLTVDALKAEAAFDDEVYARKSLEGDQ